MPGYMLRNNQTGHPVMGDPLILFSYSFIILFSACKIMQSPMQPIYKDEAEVSSLEKTSANTLTTPHAGYFEHFGQIPFVR